MSRPSIVLTTQHEGGFLFVPCGENGRARKVRRVQANRHVQLNYRAGCTVVAMKSDAGQTMKLRFARKKKSEWGKKERRVKKDAKKLDATETRPKHFWGLQNISDPAENADESRVMYFYAHEVASDLAGEVESGFWQRYILQRHHQEPVVRRAIVALASTYWEAKKVSRCAANPLAVTSAQQAYRAIAELRTYMSETCTPCHGVVLSCALLFYALERLRRDPQAALFHLDNSISIFETWRWQRSGSLPPSEFEVLHATLARLDANATIQDMFRSPKLTTPRKQGTEEASAFDSTEQMQDWLTVNVCHPLLTFISKAMNGNFDQASVDVQIHGMEESLNQWRMAADDFINARTLTRKQELGVLCCESHYLTCKCTIDELLGIPSSWDEHLDDVYHIAREALEIQRELRQSDAETRWALNIGITQPLLRFGQKGTIEPVRTKLLEMVKAYEAFWEYPPMCPSLWRADGERS